MDEFIFNAAEEAEISALNGEQDAVTVAAQKAFGITYLYPWQRLVIANILDAAARARNQEGTKNGAANTAAADDDDSEENRGRQIVLLPTGAGKSLCFMVPSLLLQGCTLIFYPLLALMADQERRMIEGGMKPVVFRGGQTPQEREENFSLLRNGAKIILANPEVLQNTALLDRLAACDIEHIAIDEAHCVSEWGDSFRPAYLELGNIVKKLGTRTVTAFTATASPTVLERVADILFGGDVHLIRSDSDRPNIRYAVRYALIKEKFLLDYLDECERPLIVFCATRRRAEEAARLIRIFLRLQGEKAADAVRFYHAGLSREEKTACEKWFYPQKNGILTATCAFGMGVDKKDIRTVIHLDPPATAEAYVQEAGRGGRDGSTAKAVLLWSPEDCQKAASYAAGAREAVLKDFALAKSCRRQVLLDALGGEQAACSGCDICDGSADYTRKDEIVALTVLAKVRCRQNRAEFEAAVRSSLNGKSFEKYGFGIWEQQDVCRMTDILLAEKKIRLRSDFFRRGTVDFARAHSSPGASGSVTSSSS